MINFVARKRQEYDVDSCKDWLSDTTPINVRQGLMYIISINSLYGPLYQNQIGYLKSKLLGEIIFAESEVTVEEATMSVDGVVTIDASNFEPDIFDHEITSRPHFVKLIYQAMSYFPIALFDAYKEVTGENLTLDALSEVRGFYESCSKFDSWTGHQLCSYISHSDPEAVNFISKNPQALDYMPDTREARDFMIENREKLLPMRLSHIFPRVDLYEENLSLVKAAILGGAFELIHFDRDNWSQSTLKPRKGLEWAKKKGICYHSVLDELLLASDTTPTIASEYTTPLLTDNARSHKRNGYFKRKSGKKRSHRRFV